MISNQIDESIRTYLNELGQALSGQDSALIQDAQFDSEDHLRAALDEAADPIAAVPSIIAAYGTPEEIAQYYLEIEATVNLALYRKPKAISAAKPNPFFGIVKDLQAYRSLAYMTLALPLGLAYFAWLMIVGVGSASASVLVIGVPFFLLFLKSMQYISLFEGRLIETLLGERMPRRPKFPHRSQHNGGWAMMFERIRELIGDRQSWTTVLYLALALPLGLAYFFGVVISLVLSVAVVLSPIVDPIVHAIDPSQSIDIDWYWFPVAMPAGVIGVIVSLHMAKFLGKQQARLAKHLLVKRRE